ncbi:hypothetical protein T492DRAFT_135383 [Pavlovales sp. CCMP2436]|nr:hypothetical protein T492DRAFT_135383 [Pavlovales sp. CCMP2436]
MMFTKTNEVYNISAPSPIPLYRTVRERTAQGPSQVYGAVAVCCGGSPCAPAAALPGVDPLALFAGWAAFGVCEPSALSAAQRSAGASAKELQPLLDRHVFVCLGGTSEMCPLKMLLALGATCVAIARPGYKLQALIQYARGEGEAHAGAAKLEAGSRPAPPAGTLIVPVPIASAATGETDGAFASRRRWTRSSHPLSRRARPDARPLPTSPRHPQPRPCRWRRTPRPPQRMRPRAPSRCARCERQTRAHPCARLTDVATCLCATA